MKESDREALAVWHLKNCPLFAALEPRELGEIFHQSRIVGLGPNEIVPGAGGDEPSLWVVKRGHVKLGYVDHEGHTATVLILGPGDLFGSVMEGGARDYGEHCSTITSACLCRISASRFEALLRKYPQVAYSLMKANFSRIHRLQARLADFMVRPAEARLALVLLDLNREIGEDAPEGGRVLALPLSHQDLAQLIGSSREMVTHLLGRFRRRGVVATTRERIVLTDRTALEVARDVW